MRLVSIGLKSPPYTREELIASRGKILIAFPRTIENDAILSQGIYLTCDVMLKPGDAEAQARLDAWSDHERQEIEVAIEAVESENDG